MKNPKTAINSGKQAYCKGLTVCENDTSQAVISILSSLRRFGKKKRNRHPHCFRGLPSRLPRVTISVEIMRFLRKAAERSCAMSGKTKESKLIYFNDVKPTAVCWLAKPFIARGKITVIQGDPGSGKTTLALSIAAHISTGKPLPFSTSEPVMGSVIYQNAEDCAADTLKPRLISMGADCSKIAFIEAASLNIDEDCKILEQHVRETNASMLTLDPFTAFMGSKADMCRATDIRRLMGGLMKIAEKYNCAMVLIAHMNKSAGAKDLYRALGSIDIPAAARSVMLVGRDEDGETRYVRHIKSSLVPEASAFAFRICENSSVEFLGDYEGALDDTEPLTPADNRKSHKAEEIILNMTASGQCRSTDIMDACGKNNISPATVKRVKGHLGIKSIKKQDEWYWMQ